MLANTGLRISELLKLTLDDVQGRDIFYVVGKGKKDRPVEISGALKEDIEQYLASREKINAKIPYLFISTWKRKLSVDRVQDTFQKLANKAGLRSRVTPHVLRHSFATWLNDEGIDIIRLFRNCWVIQVLQLPRFIRILIGRKKLMQ